MSLAGETSVARGARVQRTRTAQRLAAAIEAGSLLLIAPAGSGKTMALEEALALRTSAVAWIRCTSSDTDPGRFLTHLVAALGEAAPGAADVIGERLSSAFGPIEIEAAMDDLVSELERLVSGPLTIVFDDAEQIAESPESSGLLERLLHHDAPEVRIAIAARRPLALKTAKLAASGGLVEVSGPELAFSADECRELIQLMGETGSRAELESLMEATEGWPLGVALSARTGGRSLASAPGSRSELWEYLDEEVLAPLPDTERRALLASALPRELTPAIATAIGLPEGFISATLGRDLFLRSLTGSAGHSYHPLFREFLLERLETELAPSELAELHASLAGGLMESAPLEAIEHWLAAGREAEAASAIGRHSQAMVRSSPEVVREWIDRVGPEWRREPAIRLIEGNLAMGIGRHESVVEPLRAAASEWERRGSRAVWSARFSLAQALIVLGRFDEVPPLAEGFDNPATDGVVAAPMVGLWAAIAIGGTGRRDEGAAMLARAQAHPLGGIVEPIAIAYDAYYVLWHQNRLDDAAQRSRQATTRMEEFDPVRWQPYNLWYRAYVLEARGEMDEAVTTLQRSRQLGSEYGLGAYPGAVAGAMKAGFDARAGRTAEAELELSLAEPHLTESWHGYDLDLTRAEIAARRGDRAEAIAAVERGHSRVSRGYLGERLRAATLMAPLLERLGNPARAQAILDSALSAATPGTSAPRLLALKAWLCDDEDAGLEHLAAAWEQAGDASPYLVRGEWPRIGILTWRAVERGVLDPAPVIDAIARGLEGGETLLGWLDHPVPEARRAAAAAAAACGHPDAPGRLDRLAGDPDGSVTKAARQARERLSESPPALAVTLFGSFEIRRGGRRVEEDEWQRRVAERLVRLLLVRRGAVVIEDELFEAFWPGRERESARRSLQVAVSCARGVLDPPGTANSVVEVRERSYRLTPRPGDSVDTEVFSDAARAALETGSVDRLGALRSAAALWRGEPLPEERYEAWSAAWRSDLTDLYGEVLSALTDACFESGDAFGATVAARKLVEQDPASEVAHRGLMRAFSRSGRRANALRQFLDCRRVLVDELGIEPSAETTELHRAILAGEGV